ncbi:hypothetical protein COO91_09973 (plasmid) [Nostoc flagelliforme CCNUN1]|uniref:Uncharacterized protein n=1 Tax=Nostoc flagelliforme CCNUN1 TaxID=2038116 RepID=A0A2K8T857_9NOSO|nr:hypothetical protein COO91_09973 [Nostoc flagelliforme CCNUN1]
MTCEVVWSFGKASTKLITRRALVLGSLLKLLLVHFSPNLQSAISNLQSYMVFVQ